jgi:glycosyltransferase involved in cell wall biosynthesis
LKVAGQDIALSSQVMDRSAVAAERSPARTPDVLSAGSAQGRRRRWAINGDFVTLRRNGVARYAREVTRQLDELLAEGHPLTRDLDIELIVPRIPDEALQRIPVRLVPEFRYPRLPQFWVQAQLPFHVRGGLLSFCNLAPVATSRHIACIHDLHTKLMPESYGRGFRLAHQVILPLVGRRAARITTVSGLSKQHLVEHGVAAEQKISITYNGSDHARAWDASRSQLVNDRSRPYAICFGRPERYKNTELLVALAPKLDAIGLDLWVVGDTDPQMFSEHLSGSTNVRLLGRIGDDDLAKALSGATCFLFPSRIEGFGIPAVEAMIHRCPVIASTAQCLPEVCGDAALYADPDDLDAWLAAVTRLNGDRELRAQLVALGVARADRYSWRAIAERYLTLMAEVDGIMPECGADV